MSKTRIERPGLVPNLFTGPSIRRRRSPRNIKSCNGNSTITTPTTLTAPHSTHHFAAKHTAQIQTETIENLLPDDLEPFDNQVAGHMYDVHGKLVGEFSYFSALIIYFIYF